MKNRRHFHFLISLPALIVMAVLFVLPLSVFFSEAFLQKGTLEEVFRDPYTLRLFLFSLSEALVSALISTLLAIPFALFFSRYSFPGRKTALAVSSSAFALPSVLAVLGFVIWYGNNGFLNRAISFVTGGRVSIKFLYSLPAVILCHVYLNFPVAFSLLSGTLSSMGRTEEITSRLMGKTEAYTFLHITLPKLRGALFSSFTLIFLFCFPSFLIVMGLGGNPRYYTVEAEIYRRTYTDLSPSSAAALSLFSFIFLSLLILLSGYGRKEKRIERHIRNPERAKGWKAVAAAVLLILLFLFMAPPMLSIVYRAFFTRDGAFTLSAWSTVFSSGRGTLSTGLDALLSSLIIAISSALLSSSLAVPVALSGAKGGNRLVPLFSSLPMAAGSVTLGLGYATISTKTGIGNGAVSYLLVILVHLVCLLPFSVRTILPGARRISDTLSLSSLSFGKSRWETYRSVELPTLAPYRRRAFAFAFALSLGEVNATMALSGGRITTLPLLIWRMINQYNYQGASALAVVLLTVTTAVFAYANKEDF